MKNAANTIEKLNKELATLNKKYVALDKSLKGASESEAWTIGDKMEEINQRMCVIGGILEG